MSQENTRGLPRQATMPVAAALSGLLAQFVGLRAVFAAMGVVSVAVTIATVSLTDADRDAAERAAPAGPAATGVAGPE